MTQTILKNRGDDEKYNWLWKITPGDLLSGWELWQSDAGSCQAVFVENNIVPSWWAANLQYMC